MSLADERTGFSSIENVASPAVSADHAARILLAIDAIWD